MSKTASILRVAIVLAGLVAAAYCASAFWLTDAKLHSAQLLPSPQPLIHFILEDQAGEKFTPENLRGHWSLIFFGFSHCPDICPLQLQELAKVLRMAKRQNQGQVRVIFISLDPERDTAQRLADYLAPFQFSVEGQAPLVGLRGSNDQLSLLNHFFAIDYSRQAMHAGSPLNIPGGVNMPAEVKGDYQVEHSGRIFIIDSQGRYLGSFPPPQQAQYIWNDLQWIMK